MNVAKPLRVLSVYDGFFSGGARILHSEVIKELQRRGQEHTVLSINSSMTREATIQPMEHDRCYQELLAAGIKIYSLGRTNSVGANRVFSLTEIAQAKSLIEEADVILSLKEQPLDLLEQAGFTGKPIVTCLHRSDPEHQSDREEEFIRLMAGPDITMVTTSADASKAAYVSSGIPAHKLTSIVNGVDLGKFRFSRTLRASTRARFGIPQSAKVVIFVARYDAMKNVPLFVASAARFLRDERGGHVLMAGAGMKAENELLMKDLADHFGDRPELLQRLHLVGVQSQMEQLYPAADVVALTSAFGETYPLCLVEGLVCGAVPVSTVVGDSVDLVSDLGIITPSDPDIIAAAWREAIRRRRYFLKRIIFARESYSDRRMFDRYQEAIQRATTRRRESSSSELTTAE